MTDTPKVERRDDGELIVGGVAAWCSKGTTVEQAEGYVEKYRSELQAWQADLAKAEAVLAFLQAEADEQKVDKLAWAYHSASCPCGRNDGHSRSHMDTIRAGVRAVLAAQREEQP